MTSPGVLIGVASAVIAAAAFYLATRAARATAASGTHAVDAVAYTRASQIYEDTIANLRADIVGLRADISAARDEIRDLHHSNDRMAAELRRLGIAITGPDRGGDGPPGAQEPRQPYGGSG